jgi:hypothetical protein
VALQRIPGTAIITFPWHCDVHEIREIARYIQRTSRDVERKGGFRLALQRMPGTASIIWK